MALETFYREVEKALKAEKRIELRGFGTFYLKLRKQKIGRNVKRNKPVVVPEHYVVMFRPVLKIKNEIKKIEVK